MRVSTDPNDPGYEAWCDALAAGHSVKIFLDGIEQRQCTMADSDEGIVTRCVLDDDGCIQVDPNNQDEVWAEIVKGRVEIVSS